MSLDWESAKYLIILPITFIGKVIWNDHKSLQSLKEEIAADYPTWTDVKQEITGCSDQKDKMIEEQKEDLTYIRGRLDKLVDRELDKKE